MNSDIRWFLRAQTADVHASLDRLIGQFDDRRGYLRYLEGLFRFRAPVEQALSALSWPEGTGGFRPSRLARAIGADIDDLGARVPAARQVTLDLGGAGLLGVLYVLEGAALGARVLIRRAEALGFDGRFGARHLALAAGGAGWAGFLALAGAQAEMDRDRAAAASLATFALAHEAFAVGEDA
jgi:heme oxygenase